MRRLGSAMAVAFLFLIGVHAFGVCAEFEKKAIGGIVAGDPGEEFYVSPKGSWLVSVAPSRAEPLVLFDVMRAKKLFVSYAGDVVDLSMADEATAAWQSDHELMVVFSVAGQLIVYEIKAGTGGATASPVQAEDPRHFFSGTHKHSFGTTVRTPDDAVGLGDSPLRNGAFGISAKEADSGRSLYLFYQEKKIATYVQTTGFLSFNKPLLSSLSVPLFAPESWQKHEPMQGLFYTVSWVTTGLRRASTDLYYFSIKDKKVSLVDKDVAGLMMWAPDARSFFYAKKDAQGAFQLTVVIFKLPQGQAAPSLR